MRLHIHGKDSKAEEELFFKPYISTGGSFCVRLVDAEGRPVDDGHLLFITKRGELHLDGGVGKRHGLVLDADGHLKVH